MPQVSFCYRIPADEADGQLDAARIAKETFLQEWEPHHWHLDSVSVTADFYSVSFTGFIDMTDWSGDSYAEVIDESDSDT